jgi:hypothetical protein
MRGASRPTALRLFGALLLLLLCTAAVKTIDRRTASEEKQYFLVFAARDGSVTGHAFVVWGTEDNQKTMSTVAAFGMYPKEGKGVLGDVPGEIVNELLSGEMKHTTDRLIVRVDADVYARADRIRRRWVGNSYRTVERDCVTFVQEISRSAGLKTPERGQNTLMPHQFIAALMRSND